jgi:hypothetical protein
LVSFRLKLQEQRIRSLRSVKKMVVATHLLTPLTQKQLQESRKLDEFVNLASLMNNFQQRTTTVTFVYIDTTVAKGFLKDNFR